MSVGSGQFHWIDGSPHGSCFSASLATDILKFTCLGAECFRVSRNLLKLCLGTQLSYLESLSGVILSGFALGFSGGSGPNGPHYFGKTFLRGQEPMNRRFSSLPCGNGLCPAGCEPQAGSLSSSL